MSADRIRGLVILAVALSAGVWAASKAWALHCGGGTGKSCTENVRETKHNLAANDDILSSGTSEVCVFCHTPHGGRTDVAGGGAPLWNRALPATDPTAQFQNYNSPNFDNNFGGGAAGPRGVSLACLSCHDGTIALDALINAPGSGGYTPANRSTLTGTSAGTSLTGLTFGPGLDSTESLPEGDRPASPSGGGFNGGLDDYVGPGGGMEPFPNLSRNLTDDHPISIRMPDTDPQFDDALANSNTFSPGGNVRYVSRAGAQIPTDPRDRVRLYNSGPGSPGGGTSIDWVECASCHNPHTPRTTFLRLPSTPTGVNPPAIGEDTVAAGATRNLNHEPNQGSLICLTCHQK
jgi:hypothetical protein